MISGKTESGFEFSLEDEILDDYELLEMLHKIDNGDYGLVTEMVDQLLGEDQKKRLKEHIRSSEGKVSAKKMLEEVMQIFNVSGELKN